MKQFSFDQAKTERQTHETVLANRLGNASNKNISTHVSKILQEDRSDYANFLITIRDQVVREGKSEIWSQLLEIKDKVKSKQLITQDQVDLLQGYNLKCRRGMNVQGRTFTNLHGCDFFGANIDNITVKGDMTLCILYNDNKSSVITGMKIEGSMNNNTILSCIAINTVNGNFNYNIVDDNIINNTILGFMHQNEVTGHVKRNKVDGNINNNTVGGDIENNNVLGDIEDNTVSGSILMNTVSGKKGIGKNTVSGDINYNTVTNQICDNKVNGKILYNFYNSAMYNKFGFSSDLKHPSNTKLSDQERIKLFGK